MMKSKIHQRLDDSTSSFRLLEPLPRSRNSYQLHTFQLSEAPPFIALSYVWGVKSPKRKIILNGEAFTIRPNLAAALDRLQARISQRKKPFANRDSSPLLWIDAICIDQENLQERSHQVGMMGDIYSSAAVVVAWLGENRNQVNELGTLVSECGLWGFMSSHPYDHSRFSKAISDLSSHDYWSRLWVVQEFCLANTVIVILGVHACDADQLAHISRHAKYFHTEISLAEMRQTFRGMVDGRETVQIPFFEFFQSLGTRRCSDPRDRVFGLLSLFRGQFDYRADYTKNAEETYLSILQYLVSSDQGRGLVHVFGIADVEPQLRLLRDALQIPLDSGVDRRKIYRTVVKLAISSEKD